MALAPLLEKPELNESQMALQDRFLEETGYGRSDILSLSYETGIFLTFHGGKYQVTDNGIEYLAGPPVKVEDRMEL